MNRHTTAKIAVSLPAKTLRSVEIERKRTGRSRSSIVAEALEAWLRVQGGDAADRAYIEAYARQPEEPEEAVPTEIMAAWDSWDEDRVAEKTRRRAR